MAVDMCTAKGKPCLSTRMLIFIPLTFFPPSMPRFPQVGDDRHDRLSATSALLFTSQGEGMPMAVLEAQATMSAADRRQVA